MTTSPLSTERLLLSPGQIAIVRALVQEYLPGLEVRAFGSRARGSAKPRSDLDLLIMRDQPQSPRSLALLADAFAESDLPFKVDVLDASTVEPAFLAQILDQSIVIQRGTAAESLPSS